MTDELKQQFTLRISRANSTELVVILYEMTLVYLDECEAWIDKDLSEFKRAIQKARGCLNELLESINYEYEPAINIRKLMFFCIRRLANAEVTCKAEPLEDIKKVVIPLKDAFAKITPQNPGGSVMGNSQDIYVGLTYGKNKLTENMTDQGFNRGMRI